MDPVTAVSLAAGLIQIITATVQTIQFLNDVRDAPKDRAKIVKEAANLLGLLTSLQYRMEDANAKDAWYGRLLSLGGEGGPLNQYKQAMENLAERLKPKSGVKDLQRRLKWTLDKKHIKETLDEIERLKALIGLALQEDNFELSLRIKQDISNVGQDVVGISQTVAKLNINQSLSLGRDLDEERQAAISWLSPLNFSIKQNDVFNRRQNGTGRWLLEAEEFKSWLSGDKRYLWCPGLPGGGKTILTSIVVDYLEQTFSPSDAAVIYIYNSYKEHDEQSATNLVGSLLQQVVRKKSAISDGIMTMYRQHSARRTRPSLSELSSSLRLESKDFTHVFVLVDALDECAEANGARESLLKELHGHLVEPNTHLMITSRFIAGLEYDSNEVMFLEIRASGDDIEKYLYCRISKERRLARHVENDRNLHDAIIKTIVNSAKGMFLLAQLHLDSLAKKHNKRDVRLALHSLPKELNGTYDEAMHRIYSQPTEDVALAKRVLSWISCAKTPLTVLEVQHALAIEPNATNIDEEAFTEEDLLVSVCVGLVTIEEESSIIGLVHFTTQEYFERTRIRHFPTAEIHIALSCLTYLLFDGYAVLLFSHSETREIRDRYPLLQYITTHWASHTRGEPEENRQVQRLALQLLENKHKVAVLHRAQIFAKGLGYRDCAGLGLPMAASFGLTIITTLLLDRGAQMENANPPFGQTALHYAAQNGHDAVVKLLLRRGAQIDAPSSYQQTALMLAAASGHALVVQVLLENGAAIEPATREIDSPLNLATMYGGTAVMALLLQSGADVDAKDRYGKAPIHIAIEYEDVISMIRMLPEGGADVSTRDSHEKTPLGQTVSSCSSTMVRLLLEAGADINAIEGRSNGTALFKAVYFGQEDTVQLLLDSGADIQIRNNDGETALFHGTDKGDGYTTKLLLEAGADVNARDRYGRTTLFAAARRGAAAVVRLLLKEGADVNTRENNGKTVLHAVVCENWYVTTSRDDSDNCYDPVVQSLLEAGVDFDARDGFGRTALHSAAERGYTGAVQLLLHAGAELDAREGLGRTALHIAVKKGHYGAVQSLLNVGAELDARDDLGRTALHVAAKWNATGAAQLLLDAGADYELKAHGGKDARVIRTPLEIAVSKQHWHVIELLSKAKEERQKGREGLDINAMHSSDDTKA